MRLVHKVRIDCPRIDVCGDHCHVCYGENEITVDLSALATFAHNIAWGAALCASFDMGKRYGAERVIASWNGGGWTYPFEPGCGKAAP